MIKLSRALGKRRWLMSNRNRDGNFVDYMVLRAKGGNGGSGAASFFRTSRNPKGKPAGGNGGRGGNVIFIPDATLDSLNHLEKLVFAERGGHGGRNMREGRMGSNAIIRVPLGTEIKIVPLLEDQIFLEIKNVENDVTEDGCAKDGRTENTSKDDFIKGNFTEESFKIMRTFHREKHPIPPYVDPPKQVATVFEKLDSIPFCAARGGKGGKGNHAFGKNNHECELGQAGEQVNIELNLKTMADVGLVGLPNAGKSSFLAAVSNAHPRIAPYPFTTLNPYIGIIEYRDGRRLRVADIPGLVEGAHQNRGLGHSFLKHISKARLLAMVIDFGNHEEPWRDMAVLTNELELYETHLSRSLKIIIANKADLLSPQQLFDRMQGAEQWLQQYGYLAKIFPISAKFGLAITKVTEALYELARASTVEMQS